MTDKQVEVFLTLLVSIEQSLRIIADTVKEAKDEHTGQRFDNKP